MKKKPKRKEEMKVHPAAAVFPLMPEDELEELAADIKQNGLRESIKRHGDLLIDGRNRLAACRIAGVEPRFEELNSDTDPVAYILSENIARRHMTKGQRAMVMALIHPEKQKGGRGKTNSSKIEGFSANYLSQARMVLAALPELAAQVRDGIVPLTDAYEQARAAKAARESGEEKVNELRAAAPDLADLVAEERMSLQEALAAKRERDEQRENELRVTERNLRTVLLHLVSGGGEEPVKHDFSPQQLSNEYSNVLERFDLKELELAAQTMSCIAKNKKKGGEKR